MQLVIQLGLDNATFRDEDEKPNAWAIGLKVEEVGATLYRKGLPKEGEILRIADENGNTVGTVHTTGS